MGKKKDRAFWESAFLNNRTFQYYYNRLLNHYVSTFEWDNLDPSVNERFMELCMFTGGKTCVFNDEVMGMLALRSADAGPMSIYNIPTVRNAYASNGYSKMVNESDSVLIYDNYAHLSPMPDIEMFAKRLYDLDRTIDVNAKAQKTPIIITCDESERLTMENLMMKYDGNIPFIFGHSGMNVKGINVIKTDAPFLCDRLYTLKTQIWNEALTYIGIPAVAEKKERRIITEVGGEMGGVFASRYTRLEARLEGCEKVNSMFDKNWGCHFRSGAFDECEEIAEEMYENKNELQDEIGKGLEGDVNE